MKEFESGLILFICAYCFFAGIILGSFIQSKLKK